MVENIEWLEEQYDAAVALMRAGSRQSGLQAYNYARRLAAAEAGYAGHRQAQLAGVDFPTFAESGYDLGDPRAADDPRRLWAMGDDVRGVDVGAGDQDQDGGAGGGQVPRGLVIGGVLAGLAWLMGRR